MTLRFTIARAATMIAVGILATIGSAHAQTVSEDFEDGTLGAFSSSGSPGWSASTTRAYTGSYSAHAPDVSYISDLRLTSDDGVEIPSNLCSATLSFYHWHQFDWYPTSNDAYDGGVLEISSDGGTTWDDAGSLFVSGGYNGQLNGAENNPLGSRYAWVLSSGGWQGVEVDLSSYAGETIYVRLRIGTGSTTSASGWYVDDISIEVEAVPTISVSLDQTLLWPPDHSMANIEATVVASGASGATVALMSVTSNEADNGADDGNTINDIQGAGSGEDYLFQLRAERSGSGTGRIYTVTYRITNPGGCYTEASATVTVPLSSGNGKVVVNGQIASSTVLQQNVPNPFAGMTTIPYEVTAAGSVSLTVFDAMGRTAATLVDAEQTAGRYTVELNGNALPSGTYYYVLDVNGDRIVRSMILSR